MKTMLFTILPLLLFAQFAHADDITENLQKCAKIESKTKRLGCFDELTKGLPTDSKDKQTSSSKEDAESYFKSDKEPKVKDAKWTSDTLFKVGVLDDGTRRDGYAQYVCSVLKDDFKISKVDVHVIDIAKLAATGEWVKLGEAVCK